MLTLGKILKIFHVIVILIIEVIKLMHSILFRLNIVVKFEVELSSDMTTRHENIPLLWEQYLGVLEEAKKNLEANKEKFKTDLLDQAEVRSTVFLFIFFLYKLAIAHDFTHARYFGVIIYMNFPLEHSMY